MYQSVSEAETKPVAAVDTGHACQKFAVVTLRYRQYTQPQAWAQQRETHTAAMSRNLSDALMQTFCREQSYTGL